MLFVHGFPEFWYSWRHQLREFSKDYWCVAIDMRGYNLSDKPKGVEAYRISYLAQDVREVVEALGRATFFLDRFNLIFRASFVCPRRTRLGRQGVVDDGANVSSRRR
jgi:pimeloyl-ACP methyl ester carboxylesterase